MKRVIILIMALVMCSCSASRTSSKDETGAPFVDHPNPGVKYPARFGGVVGVILGVPLTLIALPITVPIAIATDSNMAPAAPLVGMYAGVATVFGAITWPLFGWWKSTNDEQGH